ncbi:MocR-like pyridoxine biosynthesis transcription factor PdxR [Fibrisoma limi]|nr:PLP-dependent aminotransferase family protein [Fibrisoma limi]
MSKSTPQIDLPGLQLDRSSPTPLHQQIYTFIREAIGDGRLKANYRLPATRVLAGDWGISRNVVLLAFEQLILEGYLCSKTGAGTYVAACRSDDLPIRPAAKASRPQSKRAELTTYSLLRRASDELISGCSVDREAIQPFQVSVPSYRDFPFSIWSNLAMQVYRGLHIQHLGYDDAGGYWPLREAIAEHVQVNRAVRCTAEQVVIVQGTQQALYLAGSLLLQPGDPFWMEDPGYQGAVACLRAAGGIPCPVPTGPAGFDLDYALQHHPNARVVYLTPSHQYPLGGTLPYPTRKRLLDWAAQHEGWIIEDDYDSELRYSGRPLPSLQGLDQAGRVVYIGTFSKTLFPALRIGYIILPDASTARLFIRAKALLDRQNPVVEQMILARFIQEGHFQRHIRRMRQLYKTKQTWLLEALQTVPDQCHTSASDAGMHLVAWLPTHLDDRTVSSELATRGVTAPPLANYTLAHRQPPALLLGYSAFTKDQLETAVATLTAVLRTQDSIR